MVGCHYCNHLTMSKKTEKHVIQKHFLFEDWYNIEKWQSFFFANEISPQKLFEEVQNVQRCHLRQIGCSGDQFLYTKAFDFDLGVYPLQGRTTNIIKIVCDYTQCQGCGVEKPIAIKTIYPWNRHCALFGRH